MTKLADTDAQNSEITDELWQKKKRKLAVIAIFGTLYIKFCTGDLRRLYHFAQNLSKLSKAVPYNLENETWQ